MIRFEYSITVDRPVEEVFAYTTAPEKIPEWQSGGLDASAQGPLEVGQTITEIRKFLGRRIESKLEVEQYEPPRKFAARVTSGLVPFRFEQTTEPERSGTRSQWSSRASRAASSSSRNRSSSAHSAARSRETQPH